ncbi:hypothetical protein TNCV_208241 [Trichonephila clavipes]|uniref:Uncharacterized protein n=1 Tax=Trichonephila clavipes TaxID=2585209 RepID=A0A8X6SUD5_TRICX|nr:hypothetical protein TNCV_208241 [Trichonephila clavipes]
MKVLTLNKITQKYYNISNSNILPSEDTSHSEFLKTRTRVFSDAEMRDAKKCMSMVFKIIKLDGVTVYLSGWYGVLLSFKIEQQKKMATRPDRIKYLTDAEIQELLAQSDGELSDIDDPDFENISESDTDSENLENDSLVYEEIDQPSTSKVGQKRKRIRTRWDNSEFMNFNLNDLPLEFRDTGFQGEVLSPTEYFTNFFPEIFWKECVEQTNLYAFEKKEIVTPVRI